MSGTDRECIRTCLNGHPDAYRQLVRRYQAPLLSYLVGRLGDMERAEEAAQETFVRAFFALSKLNSTESFFPWLFGIGHRVAREQQRAERRYRAAVGPLALAGAKSRQGPTGGTSVTDGASPPRSQPPEPAHDHALERALAELPATYSAVVLLRYYGELSCAQVARRLGVPLGTATKRLSRAHGILRESFRRYERQEQQSGV